MFVTNKLSWVQADVSTKVLSFFVMFGDDDDDDYDDVYFL
jgi:hypothetical protein